MNRKTLLGLAVASGVLFLAHREEVSAYATTGVQWNVASANFSVNPNFTGASSGTPTQQIDEIREAASAWTNQAQIPFAFNYAGTTSNATVAYDGTNSVYFSNTDGNGALAIAYWWSVNNVTQQFDIVFYGRHGLTNFAWSKNPNAGEFDIRSVATHEFGHVLGLNHSASASATMAPIILPGSTTMRTLEADDVNGARSLYGVATPTISAIFPESGTAVGGTLVTLSGSWFTSNLTQVTVGGVPAIDVTVVNTDTLTFVTPPATTSGPVDVAVSCNGLGTCAAAGFRYEELSVADTVAQGSVVPVSFHVPQYSGAPYQACVSLLGGGDTLLGDWLDAADKRSLPVAIDDVFVWAVTSRTPTWFTNFYGNLDGAGNADGFFAVPTHPAISGITFRMALCVFDADAVSGIGIVSNGATVTVQ